MPATDTTAPPTIPAAHLAAWSRAEQVAGGGLVVIEILAQAPEPLDAVLRLEIAGEAAPILERPVALRPQGEQLWAALHSHLLPDGPVRAVVELAGADGQVLARRTLTLQIANDGPQAAAVARSLRRSGAPLAVSVCDSAAYDYADDALSPWFDRDSASVDAHLTGLAARGASAAELAALRRFVDEGYLVLPERIADEHLDRLNAALDDAVARKVEGYEWGASQRLHNLHLTHPAIAELWRLPAVLRMLGMIFDAPAVPWQSLTYVFGSEQQYHQDTVALTVFPAGRMCGVWTALEDVRPESGELAVYPGSHRLPRLYLKELGLEKVRDDWSAFTAAVPPRWKAMLGDMPREVYRPKAGEVLIWHENLMHAGVVRRQRDKSRRSIVCHYFADGCIAYHDVTGLPGRRPEPDGA